MKLATTTGDFARVCHTPEACIAELYRAGFRYIDMSFYGDARMSSYLMKDDYLERAKKIKYFAEGLGMTFVQAHSPGGNSLKHDEQWQLLLDSTIRSVEVCAVLGIPFTVVHAGMAPGIGKDEFYEKNLEFYKLLYPVMEKTGVKVLTENSTRANMGEMYYFYNGADMKEFLDDAGHPLLGACWDTGHANCEGHNYRDLVDLGRHLVAVHINDNRGGQDEHVLPFCGTVSMDEVMHGLIDNGFAGPFTLECDSKLRPGRYWLGNRVKFEGDKRLFDPPLALYRKMEEALFETGKYILQSYYLYEE